MKKYTSVFILSLILLNNLPAQENIYSMLDLTLSYRGISAEDITIPFDTLDKINTNQCKLILPIVYSIMKAPLTSMPELDSVMNYKNLGLLQLVYKMFRNINYYTQNIDESYTFTTDLPALADLVAHRIKQSHDNENKLLQSFSKEELDYLAKNLFSLFIMGDVNAPENYDIYKLDASEDSSSSISRRTLDILSKVDRKKIYENCVSDFIFYFELYQFLQNNKNYLQNPIKTFEGSSDVQGNILYYYNKDDIKIVIGGPQQNTYIGKFDLIIDLEGDDVYRIDRDTAFNNNFNCIIDLSGSDYYSSNSKFALGASVFSSGFIFDKEGDDTYKASSVNLGSAICGMGLILDENGSDIYSANSFSIGAGSFGVGMIVDRNGNDFYIANTFSQGFGMTEGIGIIIENKGNDTYTINPLTPDIGRSNDHFLSMCQGFGFGLRPYYAGGIGIICDGEGNDNYACDIFGQGGSYWYSLGIITDSCGNDKYTNYHYGQGSGIHYSVGLVKDYEGWDLYTSNWVSQGCGHDNGFGLCWDVKGNDNYACYGLSQGAGSANGIGILIDESGRDGYLSKDNNTMGFGLPGREYGSIGILLDASGSDFYSKSGSDSLVSNNSRWGILNDNYLPDIHPEIAEEQFKIDIDTTILYSRDDLYMFARTLEPRFSKWAAYGLNKMANDSVNTAEYLFSKLGSDDIRDIVVRSFIPKIGYTFSNFLIDKINQYLSGKVNLNTDELAFAIYIIGESRNLGGKELLLKLTQSENIRIRSASVNALGKMNFTDSDSEFKKRVSERLRELASAKDPKKIYNKDIAFAFKNFKNETNIPALINMMSYDYYAVRFLASEDLLQYGDVYYSYLTGDVISRIVSNKLWFQAFLSSLSNLSDKNFKKVLEKILNLNISKDKAVNYNLIELLKTRTTRDTEMQSWVNRTIVALSNKLNIKYR